MTVAGVAPIEGRGLRSRLLAPALLLLYAVAGGATFSVSKIAFAAGVSPAGFTFWQVAGSALAMTTICLLWRIRLPLGAGYLRFYGVCGLIGVALPNANMFFALAHLPAGVMAMLVATVPLFTCVLSFALAVEPFHPRRALGILVGFAGVLVILLPRAGLPSGDAALWAALALLTPLLYATSHVYVARTRPGESRALALVAGMLVAASLALAPPVILGGGFYALQWPAGPAEAAILVQVLISCLGYVLFFAIVRLAGPIFFSQVGYLVTLTGMGWAMAIFAERYSLWLWLAVALIFAGLALATGNPWRGREGHRAPVARSEAETEPSR